MPAPPIERARRQPAAATRMQLLQVAAERIRTDGLALDFANLGLDDLIRTARVSRSTVFRIWGDREAFLQDVLVHLFDTDEVGTGFDEQTAVVVQSLIAENLDRLATDEGRDSLLRDVTRVAVARNVEAIAGSLPWRMYRSMLAAYRASGQATDRVRAILDSIETRFLARLSDVYEGVAGAFGRRLLPGLAWRDIAVASASLVEGLLDRQALLGDDLAAARPVPVGGADADWQPTAIAIYGMFVAMTEVAAAD